MSYYYMSFVVDDKFAGAIIAEADNYPSALLATHSRGINPGGEVAAIEVEDHEMTEYIFGFNPKEYLYKLLDKEFLFATGKYEHLGNMDTLQ